MKARSPEPGPALVRKDRLDSWKEIAAYLNRDIRTVQRWERHFDLPVQRHPGGPKAGVFALRADLDLWLQSKWCEVETASVGDAPLPNGDLNESSRPWRGRVLQAVLVISALVIVAVMGYGISVLRNARTFSVHQPRFTPFASGFPIQVCPAWSPDGSSIAFIGGNSGLSRVFVQRTDSSSAVAITGPEVSLWLGADPMRCRAPIWSPDSQWLYFFGECGKAVGICRVTAGGGPVNPVQVGAVAGTISSDGRTLIFLAPSPDQKLRVWTASPPEGQRKLYEPVPYAIDAYVNTPLLAFAPDGNKIFSAVSTGQATDYRLLPWPQGLSRRMLAKTQHAVGTPVWAWMPDSRHLLFSAAGLGIANVETGEQWPLTNQQHPMQHPTVSPDGTRVAYQAGLSHADVIAVPLDGARPVRTLLGSTRTEQQPAASPVWPQVVYVTNKRNGSEVWIKDLEQGWDRPLVSAREVRVRGQEAQLLLSPVFSPDGLRVAFTAVSPASAAIFTVPAAGGTPVRARGGADIDELSATWSPDGQWLAFWSTSAGGTRLYRMRVGSTEAVTEIAPTCRGFRMPEWSPTGEWIASSDEDCQTVLVSPDGKSRHPLSGRGAVAWARDGKTLYQTDQRSQNLIATEIATGRRRVLRHLGDLMPYATSQPGLRASLTSDGASIVYSVLRPREEIWIMEDLRISEPWGPWLASLARRL